MEQQIIDVTELDIKKLNYKKIAILAKQDNLEDTFADFLIIKILENHIKGTIIANNKKTDDFYTKSNLKKENIFRRYSFLLKNRFVEDSYLLLDDYQISKNQIKNISDNLKDKNITFISSYNYIFSEIEYDYIIISTNLYIDELKNIYDLYLKEGPFDSFEEFKEFIDDSLEQSVCICIYLQQKQLNFIEI